jgi:hypothetical protein
LSADSSLAVTASMKKDALMRLIWKLFVMVTITVGIAEATATWRHYAALHAETQRPSSLIDPDRPTFSHQLNRLRRLRGIEPIFDEVTDDPDGERSANAFQLARYCGPDK